MPNEDVEQIDATPDDGDEENAEQFPRSYVEKLRKESQGHRQRVKDAEERVNDLSHRLHSALVAATGRFQDVSDIPPYAEEHLEDSEALSAAIDALLESKPHLAKRKAVGPVGQGVKGDREEPFSLLDRLKRSV